MTLTAPAGLAAALLAVPLVLWYVLRSRRPRVEVASTFLWRATGRPVEAAVPWQRFRPDRTFWLVLAAVLTGAVALARPGVPVTGAAIGDHTILVLDASGSMLADEDGPTRFELARRQAARLVDQAGPGQVVSIVEAGPRPRVLLSASEDRTAARRVVRATTPGHGPADLAGAFTLAASLQQPGQETVTHLITDGDVPVEAEQLAPPGLVVDPVGRNRPNLAVSRLQAVPAGAGSATALVQVRNFGLLAAQARLTLEVLDGEGRAVPVASRQVRLAPRGVADLVVPVERGQAAQALLRARIAPVGAPVTGEPAGDALSLDDQAWAVLSGPREIHALVAGQENVFLATALGSVPGVEVTAAPAVPEDLSGVDLLVVDRIDAPPRPTVPTIYVAPTAPPSGVTVSGQVGMPALTFQDPEHGLLADVDLSQVAIATAQAVTAPALRPVASGPAGPLVLAGRLGPVPVVYVGFDLLQSNLPLQVAWPVLTANAVAWLTGPPTAPASVAGSDAELPVPDGVTGIAVTPPDGTPIVLDPAWPQLDADRVGVWSVAYHGPAETLATVPAPPPLAVNPDPDEGDLSRPRPEPAPPPALDARTTTGLRVYGRELLVLPLALLLLDLLLSGGTAIPRTGRGGGGVPRTGRGGGGVPRTGRGGGGVPRTGRGGGGVPRTGRDRRLLAATAARIGAVVLLVGGMLGPMVRSAGTAVDVAFLVDASASVPPSEREASARWVADALASRAPGDRAALAVFGRDARVEYALTNEPYARASALLVDPSASDLARALRLGEGVLGGASRRRVVMLTDGRQTEGDLLGVARDLAEAGIAFDAVQLSPHGVADVLVDEVRAPGRAREGEAYDIVAILRNTAAEPAEAVVTLFADGVQVDHRTVVAPPGTTEVVLPRTAGPAGTVRYEVRLASGASDVAANDVGRAAVQVDGPPRVLVFQRTAGLGEDLARALAASGIPADVRTADTEPLPALDVLLGYDSVVLVDIPAGALGDEGMVALDQFVRDAGHGVVAIGGGASFGMGGYDGTPLDALLPVFARVEEPIRRPSVAEALVVDTSGSMAACQCAEPGEFGAPSRQNSVNKTDIAKEAIARAADELEPTDLLGVLAFNTRSEWVIPLQRLPDDEAIDAALARLRPHGNTDIAQAIREAVAGLKDADTRLRHIVLFSDGFQGNAGGLENVAREAANAGITLSVVGTGEGSIDVLRRMAVAGGGRYYAGRNLGEIPDIIALELEQVAKPVVNEGAFMPAVVGLAPATEGLEQAPPLAGYVATTEKPAARTLLQVGDEDPLLATWQAGLGTATAWTSDATARWSSQWVTWDRFSRFWADVVKDTFPQGEDAGVQLQATATTDGLRLRMEAPGLQGDVTATATVTDPGGGRREVRLDRVSLEEFEAVVPADIEGVYAVSGAVRAQDEVLLRANATGIRSYPAEYAAPGGEEDLLRQAVAAAGGRLDPRPDQVFDPAGLPPGVASVPIWPLLAAAALAVAVAGVGMRRLRLERGDLRRVAADVGGLWRVRFPARGDRPDRL